MVRIKFTGPAASVQLQPAPIQKPTPNGKSSIHEPNQVEVDRSRTPLEQERLSVKQQQSLEMVQIMLHVSFGTLFYLREFLPLPCFEDRDLKEAQRGHRISYQGFLESQTTANTSWNNHEIPFGSGRRGQPLKIIVRGTDAKADMILDALENGIFDALRRNVLEAIQLTILVDKDAPENVLESYTFSFKYTGRSGDMNSCLESLSIDSIGCVADMKSAQTARVGLESIVRRLITLSTFLPTLPNKRNLGIHLFYTDDCPPDYEPPGFMTAKTDMIRYPRDENWRKESQLCGTMDSGWHTVGLKVTSLKWTGLEKEGTETPPRIPPHLEYTDVVERGDDIGFADEVEPLRRGVSENHSISNTQPLNQGQASVLGHNMDSSEEATQDMAERQKLQQMNLTQRAFPYPDSDLVPTQPVENVNLGDKTHHESAENKKLILKEKKVAEIKENSKAPQADSDLQKSKPIKCQCGWDGEEREMMECSFCHSRQHLLCYGFKNAEDPRIPDVHACYQCLLEPDEPQLLHDMNSLVLLRRALKIIVEDGYPRTGSIFAQRLHCNGQTVVQVTDFLKKHNFIQPTPGYKAKGFIRKGLPKFGLSHSNNVHQRIEREIFDPTLKIQHHYTKQDSNSASDIHMVISYENSSFEDPSQDKSGISLASYENRDLQTPTDNKDLEESDTTKRKEPMSAGDGHYGLEEALQNSAGGGNRRSSNRISDHAELGGNDEKRRKISNYPNPIDVGADTTDNESTDT